MELNNENYFSPEMAMKYCSVSQFKAFRKCEAEALAEIKGEYTKPKSDALLQGSFLDVLLTGTEEEQEQFKKNNPSMFLKDGKNLQKKFSRIEDMYAKAKSDEYFMRTLNGKHQIVMVGDIAGIPFKVKIDSLLDNAIVDLKSAEDLHKVYYKGGEKVSFIENFGYVYQAAAYQHIVWQNTGKTLPFFLSVVTKQEEPELEVLQIDNDSMQTALDEMIEYLPVIQAIKNGEIEPTRCERCAYCRKTKRLVKPINWQDLELGD